MLLAFIACNFYLKQEIKAKPPKNIFYICKLTKTMLDCKQYIYRIYFYKFIN